MLMLWHRLIKYRHTGVEIPFDSVTTLLAHGLIINRLPVLEMVAEPDHFIISHINSMQMCCRESWSGFSVRAIVHVLVEMIVQFKTTFQIYSLRRLMSLLLAGSQHSCRMKNWQR